MFDETDSAMSNIKQRIQGLRDELRRHNQLYYAESKPTISDRAYDALLRELIDLEAEHPDLITPDSPTQRVGHEPLSAFETHHHVLPMLSLSNTYNKEELRDFDGRVHKILGDEPFTYVVEPKIDGVAISLTYEFGVLTVGSTRGDGRKGDNITVNLRTIRSIPLRLRKDRVIPDLVEIRGEVFMTKDGFANLNEERQEAGLEAFVNPRNAASGSLKQLDPSLVAVRPLDAIVYGIGELTGTDFDTHQNLLATLQTWGLPSHAITWPCLDIHQVLKCLAELEIMRHDFPFEIDGGVIKIDQRHTYDVLGATSKSPRWATSYKYEPEQAETMLVNITIQVGRTGVLTPVAELEPVFVGGTTVSRATLHNEEEIRRKDIRIGDRVVVQKAGDIIPAVMSVALEHRPQNVVPFSMPHLCPECNAPVSKVDPEVAYRCGNSLCPAQVKNMIRHFASRGAMDIEGLGQSLVDQLVDADLVHTPVDLYRLTVDQVSALERMADKSANNLVQAIEASKRQAFWRVLFGLGIRHVGTSSAQILENEFGNLENLLTANLERYEQIDGIGPVMAKSLVDFFHNNQNQVKMQELRDIGLQFSVEKRELSANHPDVSGKNFVLTGTLPNLTRSEAAEHIRSAGGNISNSVSSKTDFVVAGDKAGSKLKSAKSLGITVLDQQGLLALLNMDS